MRRTLSELLEADEQRADATTSAPTASHPLPGTQDG